MDKKMFCYQCEQTVDAPAAQEMQVSAEKRQALPNYRMS